MAITEIYVDPSIAADSGTGTIGDPFGDLEYAIEQGTFDTTNGTRVNIKAGTHEILAAQLATALADVSVSIAWAPTLTAPLVFQGYTSVAGDGGIGGISGGGSVSIIDAGTQSYVSFVDLELHNTGANPIVSLDNDITLVHCELYNTTSNAIDFDNAGFVLDCYIHNVGGGGVLIKEGLVKHCLFENGTNSFTTALNVQSGGTVERNIINIGGSSIGITLSRGSALNNSIYSAAGTGTGIDVTGFGPIKGCMNNLIEGFSGTGGVGIDLTDTNMSFQAYGGNSIYDCATAVDGTARISKTYVADETLTASPFTNASGGDFSPVDTGSVKEGSYPQAFNEG